MTAAANHVVVLAYLRNRPLALTVDDTERIASFDVATESSSFRVFARCPDGSDQVFVHALLDYAIPEASRGDVAMFLTYANYGLGIGNFEMDMADGELRCKTSIDLNGTALVADLLEPLFGHCMAAMDRFAPMISAVVAGLDPDLAHMTLLGMSGES